MVKSEGVIQDREYIANQAHPRSPNENIACVCERIDASQCFKLMSNGVSCRSVQMSTSRVSSDDRKTARIRISQLRGTRLEEEGVVFLHKIITCDEIWVHHYSTKQTSMEWRKKDEENPVKVTAGKVLVSVF